jgi:hypothetical protein
MITSQIGRNPFSLSRIIILCGEGWLGSWGSAGIRLDAAESLSRSIPLSWRIFSTEESIEFPSNCSGHIAGRDFDDTRLAAPDPTPRQLFRRREP